MQDAGPPPPSDVRGCYFTHNLAKASQLQAQQEARLALAQTIYRKDVCLVEDAVSNVNN